MSDQSRKKKRDASRKVRLSSPGTARHAVPPGAFEQALHAHQSSKFDVAEALYRRMLQRRPKHPDALHYLGVLLHQRGDSGRAIDLVRKSLQLAPAYVDAHSNLGNIYKESGRLEEAQACYRRALVCAPTHPQALGNLALVLHATGQVEPARHGYMDWLMRWPDDARAHYWYARFLCEYPRQREDIEQAVTHFRRAYALEPHNLKSLECLGMALYGLGLVQSAAAVYREWSLRDVNDAIPRHMLAACGEAAMPVRADDAYVRELFDGFAANFDEQLLTKLNYRAPELLVTALDSDDHEHATRFSIHGLDILDAGCGTGLCGPLLRSRARRLIGVDLSAGMLAQAERRGCYDALLAEELTAHLCAYPASYDVVLCADTLVYFGDLDPLLAAAAAALHPGGRLAFTLEVSDDVDAPSGYALSPSGRYQHTHDYVTQSLGSHHFIDVRIVRDTLRKEAGRGVDGWIVLAHIAWDGVGNNLETTDGSCNHA